MADWWRDTAESREALEREVQEIEDLEDEWEIVEYDGFGAPIVRRRLPAKGQE